MEIFQLPLWRDAKITTVFIDKIKPDLVSSCLLVRVRETISKSQPSPPYPNVACVGTNHWCFVFRFDFQHQNQKSFFERFFVYHVAFFVVVRCLLHVSLLVAQHPQCLQHHWMENWGLVGHLWFIVRHSLVLRHD